MFRINKGTRQATEGACETGDMGRLTTSLDGVVARFALPRARGVQVGRGEELLLEGVWWEVDVAVDDLPLGGFGDHGAVDGCCCLPGDHFDG